MWCTQAARDAISPHAAIDLSKFYMCVLCADCVTTCPDVHVNNECCYAMQVCISSAFCSGMYDGPQASGLCGICYCRPADSLLLPCKHLSFCSSCVRRHASERYAAAAGLATAAAHARATLSDDLYRSAHEPSTSVSCCGMVLASLASPRAHAHACLHPSAWRAKHGPALTLPSFCACRQRAQRDISCPCCRAPVAEVVVIPQLSSQQAMDLQMVPQTGMPHLLMAARPPPSLQQVSRHAAEATSGRLVRTKTMPVHR
jgi:hypothetical protein